MHELTSELSSLQTRFRVNTNPPLELFTETACYVQADDNKPQRTNVLVIYFSSSRTDSPGRSVGGVAVVEPGLLGEMQMQEITARAVLLHEIQKYTNYIHWCLMLLSFHRNNNRNASFLKLPSVALPSIAASCVGVVRCWTSMRSWCQFFVKSRNNYLKRLGLCLAVSISTCVHLKLEL